MKHIVSWNAPNTRIGSPYSSTECHKFPSLYWLPLMQGSIFPRIASHLIPCGNNTQWQVIEPLFSTISRENRKVFSFTCSSKIPVGFMLEYTTWNSFRCLLGSSPTKPWNIGKRWIILNFSSKATFSWGYSMHKGCWSRSGVANSFSVRLLLAISFKSGWSNELLDSEDGSSYLTSANLVKSRSV